MILRLRPRQVDGFPWPRSRIRVAVTVLALTTLFSSPAYAQTGPSASTGSTNPWQPFIDEAAARFAIQASWIAAVIRVESGGNPEAVSPKGAIGLMQLMPGTYAELRIRYGLGADPADPRDNIMAGAAYLRDMHDRFGSAGFTAAYNAGPQRYEDHLATGRPLPEETLAYVAQLAPLLSGGRPVDNRAVTTDHVSWQQAPLFVGQRSDVSGVGRSAFTPQANFTRNDRSVAYRSALVLPPGSLFVRKQESRGK
jgi:hypothetical protein